MGRQLQCNALCGQEKRRWRKNNVEQWKKQWITMKRTIRRTMETVGNSGRAPTSGCTVGRQSIAALEEQSAPEAEGLRGAPMPLCTYCHAPLAPGTQTGFDLSPLFRGYADLWPVRSSAGGSGKGASQRTHEQSAFAKATADEAASPSPLSPVRTGERDESEEQVLAHHRHSRADGAGRLRHRQRVHRFFQDDAVACGADHGRGARRQAGGRLRLQLERALRSGRADPRALRAAADGGGSEGATQRRRRQFRSRPHLGRP